MISTRRTIPSFGKISKFDNCDYVVNDSFLKHGHRLQFNYLTIRFTINWLVPILLVAPGTTTTLAFLGYNSQEVIVVLPNAGHSIL